MDLYLDNYYFRGEADPFRTGDLDAPLFGDTFLGDLERFGDLEALFGDLESLLGDLDLLGEGLLDLSFLLYGAYLSLLDDLLVSSLM